ncbi:MAG: hypothetical protein JXR34_04480 [Bacteroidales bacterium]|nr:hypothetical protein [Bacteroidales bacterium]
MQRYFLGKFVFFILGMVAGLGLFWIYGIYINQDVFQNSTPEMEQLVELPINEAEFKVKKKIKPKTKKSAQLDVSDSLIMSIPDSLTDINLSFEKSNGDTLSILQNDSIGSVDFVVMQDEKVYARYFKPSGNPVLFHCDFDAEMDSILIDNSMTLPKEGLLVEFWRSPVNFSGYRLSRQKLVLFGVFEYDSLSFHYHEEEVLLMKYKQKSFILKCGNDFSPIIFNPNKKGRKPS